MESNQRVDHNKKCQETNLVTMEDGLSSRYAVVPSVGKNKGIRMPIVVDFI